MKVQSAVADIRDNASAVMQPDDTLEALRRKQAWLAGEKEAFQAAMNDAPLETSLGILIRTAIEQADSDRRCAFYIANADGTELRHVVGMSEEYARCVEGFKISAESLACGLAVSTGQPVITCDVTEESRWSPWLWLADEYGYKGCWSFPVETSAGKVVGSFAMYFKEPRDATPRDRELAAALTHTASIIISRHQESEERARLTRALVISEANLAAELAVSQHLQSISAELIRDQDIGRLYAKIIDAAVGIMHSDFASMQMLCPERGEAGELRLLAFRGFTPEAARRWEWIRIDSNTVCGVAFKTGQRVIAPDIMTCDYVGDELPTFLQTGIRSCQTTPLVSRSGELLGMISTHWKTPHIPSQRDLRFLDVLARQAADLIERKRAEDALERRAEQLKLLVDELNHRVKNTLATVQSIAMQTLRHSNDTEDARRRFEARLVALSHAHDILTNERWEGALLGDVVAASTAPYRNPGSDRFDIAGPSLWVSPKQALAISMALHELSTNAVKYGSLSQDAGVVRIHWTFARNDGGRSLRLNWTEEGGPPVAPPSHRGFGSRLIERGVKQDLGGEVQMEFLPTGLRCTMDAAVADEETRANAPQATTRDQALR